MSFFYNKIKLIINTVSFVIFMSYILISCNFHNSNYTETKSDTVSQIKENERTVIYTAKYEVTAKASVIKCKGSGLTAELYSDYSLELKGLAKCGIGGSINLEEYTKEPADEVDDTPYKKSPYNGLVIRALNPKKDESGDVPAGYAYFYPPRPNIVNPVLRENKLKPYIGKTLEEKSKITVGLSDGSNMVDHGKINIQIHSLDSSIPSDVDASVSPLKEDGKVIVFTISTTGFSNVEKKGSYMLFDSIKMWVGTNPIAIYKIEINSKLKDMIDEEDIKNKASENALLKFLTTSKNFFGKLVSAGVDKAIAKSLDKELSITARIIENVSVDTESSSDD